MDRRLGMKITTWVQANATRIPMPCGKRLPLVVYTCGRLTRNQEEVINVMRWLPSIAIRRVHIPLGSVALNSKFL